MKLHVIGSSSAGNGYVLDNGREALVIECGKRLFDIKRALNFNIARIQGALVSHEHGDHAKYVSDYATACIPVYMSTGTADAISANDRFVHRVEPLKPFVCGAFRVLPFGVQHDAAEPFGYVITHPECGNVLFATDTYYIRYRFKGINNVMVECNYDHDLLMRNVERGIIERGRMERTLQSHMSIETLCRWCDENDLSHVNNIVLVHLSNDNSHADRFRQAIADRTMKNVVVADAGMIINLNKTPF